MVVCDGGTLMNDMLSNIDRFSGVHKYNGVHADQLVALTRGCGLTLPKMHVDLLLRSNGLEVFSGFYRIFGIAPTTRTDIIGWNQKECWKFAWGNKCDGFLCFGESAFGDQYCYQIESLQRDETSPVYLLDAVTMQPVQLESSFAAFFENELLRVAGEPYDEMAVLAHQRFGALPARVHLTYSPSLALGGEEKVENLQILDAATALIFHGDINRQLSDAQFDATLSAIEPYTDDLLRPRLRLLWSKQPS